MHQEPLTAEEHEMLLDGLVAIMTKDYLDKHPREAPNYWKLYGRVKAALGAEDITLSWRKVS